MKGFDWGSRDMSNLVDWGRKWSQGGWGIARCVFCGIFFCVEFYFYLFILFYLAGLDGFDWMDWMDWTGIYLIICPRYGTRVINHLFQTNIKAARSKV